MEGALIYLAFFVLSFGSLPVFYLVGKHLEDTHLSDLEARERALAHMLVTDLRAFPMMDAQPKPPVMVTGEAVLAADAFKSWLLSWRSLFGGEAKSFRKLMDRSRREALMRLLEEAHRQGYNAVCNVRYDSADLTGVVSAQSKNAGKKVAILASATAYQAQPQGASRVGLPTTALPAHLNA